MYCSGIPVYEITYADGFEPPCKPEATEMLLNGVQIVCQSHAVAGLDLKNLVLHVRVESCKLDPLIAASSIKGCLPALVTDDQLSTFMIDREDPSEWVPLRKRTPDLYDSNRRAPFLDQPFKDRQPQPLLRNCLHFFTLRLLGH